MSEIECGAIILAAGSGIRLGGDKLLRHVAGQAMISHVVTAVRNAGLAGPLVVVRPDDTALHDMLTKLNTTFLASPDHEFGMAHSIAAAMHALPPQWQACAICLGDMPLISADLLRALALMARHDAVIIPKYNKRYGNPRIWGRDYFEALSTLRGDRGGQVLIADGKAQIIELPWADDSIFYDIDTPAQLSALDQSPNKL